MAVNLPPSGGGYYAGFYRTNRIFDSIYVNSYKDY